MIGLLLGAGFSKWAGGLPLVSELFDFAVEPWGVRERQRLEQVQRLKAGWDRANPNGHPEQFLSHGMALADTQRKAILWYVVRRLSEPYIFEQRHGRRSRRHVLMIDEYRTNDRAGVREAAGFLGRLAGARLSGIVTTNYDLLVEFALGTKRFNYGVRDEILCGRGPYPVSTWRNPVAVTGSLRLAKIHGSVSWGTQGSKYSDGRRGLSGDALIVAPAPEKVPPPQLQHVWATAHSIISDSIELIVFGFAFNPYDEAVLDLLRQAGRSLQKVLVIDPSPPIDRVRALWPHVEASSCPSPPRGDDILRTWLTSAL